MPSVSIPRYDYAPPTAAELRRALERVLGQDAASRVYRDACRRLELPPEDDDLAPDDLRALARDLIDNGHGLARVVGRTLVIRLETHRQLEVERLQTASSDSDPQETP